MCVHICIYIYHIFFTYSSVDWHLGCFHVLAFVNSAAMNTGVHVSIWIMVFLGCMPSSGVGLVYEGNYILFSTVVVPMWSHVPPWLAVLQASLSLSISWSLLKLISIELVMPYNHLILCHLLLLLPSIFPESGSFPVNWLITLGGQSIAASASASVLLMSIDFL